VSAAGETALAGAPGPLFSARAPVPRPDRAGFYFYVRLELADGEQAWASPFWLG
jgi:hypothetical protein